MSVNGEKKALSHPPAMSAKAGTIKYFDNVFPGTVKGVSTLSKEGGFDLQPLV